MKLLTSLMVGAFFMFGAVSAQAQDFDRGLAAAQSGDFATALKEWRPLAEQGDALAQYNLGHQKCFRSTYALVQSPEST